MLFHVIRTYTKITWSILNPYIFSDIKESSCGLAINLGDEYQNLLIFIALIIAGDEGWAANFISSHLIYNRQLRCAMELIAAVGTKL